MLSGPHGPVSELHGEVRDFTRAQARRRSPDLPGKALGARPDARFTG